MQPTKTTRNLLRRAALPALLLLASASGAQPAQISPGAPQIPGNGDEEGFDASVIEGVAANAIETLRAIVRRQELHSPDTLATDRR